jgi:beta-glucosidase
VQAYVSLPGSRVRRAPRELKAFANVPVAAGRSVEVALLIERADLAYWDVELSRWVVESGDYTVAVGASSRDLRTEAVVTVAGDDERRPLTAESTMAEWMADPLGAQALTDAFTAMAAAGAIAAPVDPAMFELMSSMPLGRMLAFAGDAFGPGALEDLLKAAN